MTTAPSLQKTLADFQAKRAETMSADKLRINVDQRKRLVETARHSDFVSVGDRIASFTLTEVDQGPLVLETLLASGPLVLVFFRFAGCPACNIALPYYNAHLAPELARLGATLIGVSPQVPERLREMKNKPGLDFLIATDADNALGRRFGILYSYDDASRQAAIESGNPIGEVTGTGTWELPMPTVVVIDPDSVVRFADVSPDWLVRTEPDGIIKAVRSISARTAA